MQQRVWFDRAFDLGVPLDAFPELLERLRGTPARLEERLEPIPPSVLVARVDDRWSIQEHAGHLADLEGLWAGRIGDLLEGRDRLRAADLRNTMTWEAEHNGVPCHTVLSAFRERRGSLVHSLETMSTAQLQATALHPRLLKPMTTVDLVFFVAEHDDHHLATISARLAVGGTA